ncbi:MAG: T9SS type A sorting domain-containing protein [Candidatus Kapabacteria bacterium]|nr:T9SS type A sorting domain-containing protein [Candidatus Kapabacteria bacterium]
MINLWKYCLILIYPIIFYYNSFSQINIINPAPNAQLTSDSIINFNFSKSSASGLKLYYSFDKSSWILIDDKILSNTYKWKLPYFSQKNIFFRVEYFNYIAPKLIWQIDNAHLSEIRSVHFSQDGNYLESTAYGNEVIEWFIKNKAPNTLILKQNQSIINSNYFHNHDSIIFSNRNEISLWDQKNNNLINYTNLFADDVYSVVAHPYKLLIAAAGFDSTINIFDITTSLPVYSKKLNTRLYTISFDKIGDKILAAGEDGIIYEIDWKQDKLLNKFSQHGASGVNQVVWSTDFSPDGKLICSGGVDRTVRIWKESDPSNVIIINQHNSHVRKTMFHPSGKYVLSGSLDSTARQWDASTGIEIENSRIKHGGQILCVDYSPTGDSIVTTGRDLSIKLWENFRLLKYSDTVSCRIQYPLKIYIPNLVSFDDDNFNLPVRAEISDSMKSIIGANQYHIKVVIEIPNKLLKVNSSVTGTNSSTRKDTITYEQDNLTLQDTIFLLNCTALCTDTLSEPIRLLSFEIREPNNFTFALNDGTLTVYSPVLIKIPHLKAIVDDNLKLPIQFSARKEIFQFFGKQNQFKIQFTLEIPRNLMQINSLVYRLSGNDRKDTIFFEADGIKLQDTLLMLDAIALQGDIVREEIRIVKAEFMSFPKFSPVYREGSISIIRPIRAIIPHLKIRLGDEFDIPIILDPFPAVEKIIAGQKLSASLEIEIPQMICEILDTLPHSRPKSRKDTLKFNLINLPYHRDFYKIKALALHGDTASEPIRILKFDVLSDTTLTIEKVNGLLSIDPLCPDIGFYKLVFGDNANIIEIYPNPVQDYATIYLNKISDSPCKIIMTSADGSATGVIYENSLKSGNFIFNISMKEQSAGIYFLRYECDGEIWTKEIIKVE